MSGDTMHRELQAFYRAGKKNVANVDRKEAEALTYLSLLLRVISNGTLMPLFCLFVSHP